MFSTREQINIIIGSYRLNKIQMTLQSPTLNCLVPLTVKNQKTKTETTINILISLSKPNRSDTTKIFSHSRFVLADLVFFQILVKMCYRKHITSEQGTQRRTGYTLHRAVFIGMRKNHTSYKFIFLNIRSVLS